MANLTAIAARATVFGRHVYAIGGDREAARRGAFLGLLFVGCLMNLMLLLNIPSYFQRMTAGGLLLALVVAQGSLNRVWQR